MKNKIFIGGLNYQTSEEVLLAEISKFGEVLSLRIVTDRETGRSKGFGFATLKTEEQATKVIESLNNQMLEGRRIGVKPNIDKKQ